MYSPAWSHLQSQVLRAATWVSTPRASAVIMQTPTLSGSAFSNCSWMLLAVWAAMQEPGHNGIASALRFTTHSFYRARKIFGMSVKSRNIRMPYFTCFFCSRISKCFCGCSGWWSIISVYVHQVAKMLGTQLHCPSVTEPGDPWFVLCTCMGDPWRALGSAACCHVDSCHSMGILFFFFFVCVYIWF